MIAAAECDDGLTGCPVPAVTRIALGETWHGEPFHPAQNGSYRFDFGLKAALPDADRYANQCVRQDLCCMRHPGLEPGTR